MREEELLRGKELRSPYSEHVSKTTLAEELKYITAKALDSESEENIRIAESIFSMAMDKAYTNAKRGNSNATIELNSESKIKPIELAISRLKDEGLEVTSTMSRSRDGLIIIYISW